MKYINEKSYYFYALLGGVAAALIPLALVKLPGSIIEALTSAEVRAAVLLALLFCALNYLGDVCRLFTDTKKKIGESRIKGHLTEKLGEQLMKLPYEALEDAKTLEQYTFALSCLEENSVSKFITAFETLIASAVTISGVFYILSELNFSIIILIILVVIVSTVGEVFRLRHVFKRHQEENGVSRQLYYARNELVKKEYAKEIRLYNLTDFVTKKVTTYANELCCLWEKAAYKSIGVLGWVYLFRGIQIGVVYAYLAVLCLRKQIVIGDFAVYTAAVMTLSSSSVQFCTAIAEVFEQSKYVQALVSFLDIPQVQEKKGIKVDGPLTIEFENVSYRYPNREEFAVQDLSLTFEPNKKYALVGQNGAGKTTVVKLMLGLYQPTSGRILINGIDRRELDGEMMKKLFAPVFQDFHILGFTLEENIAMNAEVDSVKLGRAVDAMNINELVENLPEKYRTCMTNEYDESGMELSGGQKQKIAITRALYNDAAFFILDEPTAALSPQSEYELYEAFKRITDGKGVLYISHRFASCRLCDEIFVLADGKLIEQGSHSQLMAQHGVYEEMFNLQAKMYIEDRDVSGKERAVDEK